MKPGGLSGKSGQQSSTVRLHVDIARVCVVEVRQPRMLADVLAVDDQAAESGQD